jgi:hypothetical protein
MHTLKLVMRTLIPIILVATTALVGCHSPTAIRTQPATPATKAPPPFRPTLVNMFGTHITPDGLWRVAASKASLDLSRSASAQGEGWTTSGWTTDSWQSGDKPQWWTAHQGWFVFIESESRVWAYSGDRLVTLLDYTALSATNSSATIYCSPRFPCAVPAAVYSHLSEPARRAIETHD